MNLGTFLLEFINSYCCITAGHKVILIIANPHSALNPEDAIFNFSTFSKLFIYILGRNFLSKMTKYNFKTAKSVQNFSLAPSAS